MYQVVYVKQIINLTTFRILFAILYFWEVKVHFWYPCDCKPRFWHTKFSKRNLLGSPRPLRGPRPTYGKSQIRHWRWIAVFTWHSLHFLHSISNLLGKNVLLFGLSYERPYLVLDPNSIMIMNFLNLCNLL